MRKAVKGRKWINGKAPVKGVLNQAMESRETDFQEKRTNDTVHIQLVIHENQYGFYSEEYLPDTVSREGHKRADISVVIIDENASKKIDCDRIADSIRFRKRKLEELETNARLLLTAQKVRSRQSPALRMEIQMLENFSRHRFLYKSREKEQMYPFEILLMERGETDKVYTYQLRAEIV